MNINIFSDHLWQMILNILIVQTVYMLLNYVLTCTKLRLMARIPKALRQLKSRLLGQSCAFTSWRSLNSLKAKGKNVRPVFLCH